MRPGGVDTTSTTVHQVRHFILKETSDTTFNFTSNSISLLSLSLSLHIAACARSTACNVFEKLALVNDDLVQFEF